MKSKKILLVLVFAIILAVGWITTVRAVTSTEAEDRQRSLTAEADAYMEKELYVRAISLYEQALSYSTSSDSAIQEKLLRAYLAYGNMYSYVKLAEKRISAGNAAEEEYMETADYYIAQSKLAEAMQIIKTGMAKLGTDTLEAYYEEHRYAYTIRTTKYSTILPTAGNSCMPAFDGQKWGYVDGKGKALLDFIYDQAFPFNAYGYGVVMLDGTYYTILRNGDLYGVDDGETYPKMTEVKTVSGSRILGKRDGFYSYFNYDFEPIATGHQYSDITANACGLAAVRKDGRWGFITDTGAVAVDFVLEDVAVNSLGSAFAGDRAMVKENGRWYLIDTEGNHVGEGGFADAKAPESTGYVAVADSTGKWGYIDRFGEWVIGCQYDDALSFSDGLGGVKTGEEWVYISVGNVPVIEASLSDASPFHSGIAQAQFAGKAVLITLGYYEE